MPGANHQLLVGFPKRQVCAQKTSDGNVRKKVGRQRNEAPRNEAQRSEASEEPLSPGEML